MTKLILITKDLKVCHAHNMKKKIQRDLSSYLRRFKGKFMIEKSLDGFSTGLKLLSEVSGQHIR